MVILWGEVRLPVYGFAEAARIALSYQDICGVRVSVEWSRRVIEFSGNEPRLCHEVHFRDDRIVNITQTIEKGEQVVA